MERGRKGGRVGWRKIERRIEAGSDFKKCILSKVHL